VTATGRSLGWFGRRCRVLALALLALGCEDDEADGRFDVTEQDNVVQRRAEWTYRSFEVDVTLILVTRVGPESCVSTGSLTVDDALSSKELYELLPTDCAELELTEQGDIVLRGDPTGHDWSAESLSVDTDAEVITLGPVTLANAEGQAQSYRFTLSSPECPDDRDCECGLLRRTAGTMNLDFSLGRRC
jgi:hypothetical protein